MKRRTKHYKDRLRRRMERHEDAELNRLFSDTLPKEVRLGPVCLGCGGSAFHVYLGELRCSGCVAAAVVQEVRA